MSSGSLRNQPQNAYGTDLFDSCHTQALKHHQNNGWSFAGTICAQRKHATKSPSQSLIGRAWIDIPRFLCTKTKSQPWHKTKSKPVSGSLNVRRRSFLSNVRVADVVRSRVLLCSLYTCRLSNVLLHICHAARAPSFHVCVGWKMASIIVAGSKPTRRLQGLSLRARHDQRPGPSPPPVYPKTTTKKEEIELLSWSEIGK